MWISPLHKSTQFWSFCFLLQRSKVFRNSHTLTLSATWISSEQKNKKEKKKKYKDVDLSAESECGGAEQIRGAAHEHQRRQGLAGRPQDQPRPQGHHQNVGKNYTTFIIFFIDFSFFFIDFSVLISSIMFSGLLVELATLSSLRMATLSLSSKKWYGFVFLEH